MSSWKVMETRAAGIGTAVGKSFISIDGVPAAPNATMTPRFLILQTGQPVPSQRRHGGFAHWIRVAAGLRSHEAEVVDVEAGEPLPSHRDYAGVLVSGSPAMVTERLDWSERSAGWLHDAAHAGLPILGICYGHQLLAHALGGEAGDNPRGREMGTVEVRLEDAAGMDPLFAGLPSTFRAQVTHRQSALRMPEGSVLLATSDLDACQAFRWGRATWGLQFHPEFSAGRMHGYVRSRADALCAEGHDPDAMSRNIGAAPVARKVLRRFIQHARNHETR